MVKNKQVLEPVDTKRCQAEERTYRPFQLGGTLNQLTRCKAKPTWVATEITPNKNDSLCGAMSLCDFHKGKLEEKRNDISYDQINIAMKTIAETMKEVLIENGCNAVMFGDVRLLDEAANRCTHTNLMDKHPLTRHSRILTACEKSGLFVKRFIRIGGKRTGKGNHLWRCVFLKGTEPN